MLNSSALRVTLILVLLPLPLVAAAESATQWLERMSRAVHELNYVGTFVYMQDGRLETMEITHSVDEGGEHERLVSLSGPNREVIREAGRVTCYLPESEALVADHPQVPPGFPLNLPTHWEQLGALYDFKVLGESRVAGLPAQHVAIIPRDTMRYGQNYWIAKESGLLLRTDIVDSDGSVMEQLEFTSLEVKEVLPRPLAQSQSKGNGKVSSLTFNEAESNITSQTRHWRVAALPQGFELEMQRRHAMGDDGVAVEHLIYSDGLASVSVFIEPSRERDSSAQSGSSRRGSVHAYTRLLPNQRITVLGEVPLSTVQQIAESIDMLEQ